jgi:hypothetical protein
VVTARRLAVIGALVLVVSSGATAAAQEPWPPGIAWQPATFPIRGESPVATATLATSSGPAYVAWVDHAATRLALYPGSSEPPNAPIRGPTQIPSGQRWRLLATFNGGFKANSGAGGMVVNGIVEDPLLPGMGTIVAYRNGTVAILDWLGRTNPGTLVLARQNLPPLVWNGHPSTRAAISSLWGITLGGGAAVWRTGVGVTRRGDLVYAAGDNQTAASLASLLLRLGAYRAVELDINPEWPSFITYQRRGGRDAVKLVPNPQQSSSRYLKPDARDFFAVYTRLGDRASVPFR